MTSSVSDLLGVYALCAVDDHERKRVESAIASDAALQAQLESLMGVVGVLDDLSAESALPLDPAVWDRIEMATVNGERRGRQGRVAAGNPAPDVAPIRAARERRQRRFLVPIAIAAAVAMTVLSVRVVQLDSDNRALEAALNNPLAEAVERALSDPATSVATLSSPGGESRAITVDAVYQPDGTGYVIGDSLPALAADRTYQLWAVVDGRVISAGVLGAQPGIAPFQVVGELAGLAITEEIAGGVVSSNNDPVALWLAEA